LGTAFQRKGFSNLAQRAGLEGGLAEAARTVIASVN